jgi:hypothetical protein
LSIWLAARCYAQSLVDEYHTFGAGDVVSIANDHKNFIASFDLPALVSGQSVGICFRSATPYFNELGWPQSADYASYFLAVTRVNAAYFLDLFDLSEQLLLERLRIRGTNLNGAPTTNVPFGTMKISVQDNRFSVWLNGRYLHTFESSLYPNGNYAAFSTTQASSYRIHLSKLDDLLSDIVVGTRGNGMSVLSELLADRHILWRDEPDGSMYFYRTREFAGILPDIVSAVSDVKQTAWSRVCARRACRSPR